MDPEYWIGVDTGGTFTDALAIDSTGRIYLAKTPSTPQNLSIGIMKSMELLAESAGVSTGAFLTNVRKFAHGTTATVNAMVQRGGARIGFITTRGFRDHLIMMKAARGVGVPETEKVWFSKAVKPEPIVPYELIEEVTERIDHAGRVVLPLDEHDVRRAVTRLIDCKVEAIAISLLWSFRNPTHEHRICDIIRELAPYLPVTVASTLVPVIGEYERSTTAAINAYLGPVLGRYVHALQQSLTDSGLRVPVLLMQSDGGLVPGAAAPATSVTTMLSGLAAGVLGARQLGDDLHCRNIVTIDMGGTSFEVGLVHEGQPVMENFPLTPRLAPFESRWRIAAPTIDITAIGAGGGSIARVTNGVLKVGPDSAGAEPGPACYGRGGTQPTVTDAFLALGYLNPANFLGGRMKIDKALSLEAIERNIARPLGVSVTAAANGIFKLVISQMADLIHKVTIERGYDVRDFIMMAFGGSGPIHAGLLGAELGVPRVFIPGNGLATALSAYGLVASDLRYALARSRPLAEPIRAADVAEALEDVSTSAARTVKSWGGDDVEVLTTCSIDMRFKGQIHSINVAVPSQLQGKVDVETLFDRFIATYERHYGEGTAHRAAGIELVTFRAEAIGVMTKPDLPRPQPRARRMPEPISRRDVYFDGVTASEVPIFAGNELCDGDRICGPGIIEYLGNTVVVHPGQELVVDAFGNLIFNIAM